LTDRILEINSKDISKLSFKELIFYIEEINSFFKNQPKDETVDIDLAIDLYKKALELLMQAKSKLRVAREEKEKIDKIYAGLLEKNEND